jgi:CheY-like chemotaxis protein
MMALSRAPTAPPAVLVVEDEPLLRLAAVDLVEDAGFRAIDAANAAEAVSILESRTDIRVVLTDVDMPGSLDGIRLAALIRDRWPPIKVIIVSGYLRKPGDSLPKGTVFFAKPYREDQVADVIRAFIAENP